MADTGTTKPKAIEVLSFSISYSGIADAEGAQFEGSLLMADGTKIDFEAQSPGLAIAAGQRSTGIMSVAPDGTEFTFQDVGADDSGQPLYDAVAILPDGTLIEVVDLNPSGVVSFSESLAFGGDILL